MDWRGILMKNIDNYEYAYAEVVEVLNYIPMNEYKKIPKKYIVFMEENCSETCPFVYNIALPFNRQNISDTAKNILGMIFRLFIIDEFKKKELNDIDKELKKKEELEKYIKYNPDNLFKDKKIEPKAQEEDKKSVTEKASIVVYKKSNFRNMIDKIKKFLK